MIEKEIKLERISSLDNAFKLWKTITLICVIMCSLTPLIFFVLYQHAVMNAVDRVYIARDLSLERITDSSAMVKGHVTNFYKLFFQIDGYNYKKNVNAALELVGASGRELNRAYADNNYYSRIVNNNLIVAIEMDSILVYGHRSPFFVKAYAKRTLRSIYGNKSGYLNAEMKVTSVSNSEKNPFGLMIENFVITNDADIPIK